MAAVLSRQDILNLLNQKPPLVESWLSLKEQVQPNGFDLTLRDIGMFESCGRMTVSNAQRVISDVAPLVFDGLGYMDLMPGAYSITYNEIVHIPNNLIALATPRSSLLRCGVSVHTAVWDAGYAGRSQSLMVVYNPRGFRVQRNTRVVQLVFLPLTQETEGYRGIYQRENT